MDASCERWCNPFLNLIISEKDGKMTHLVSLGRSYQKMTGCIVFPLKFLCPAQPSHYWRFLVNLIIYRFKFNWSSLLACLSAHHVKYLKHFWTITYESWLTLKYWVWRLKKWKISFLLANLLHERYMILNFFFYVFPTWLF